LLSLNPRFPCPIEHEIQAVDLIERFFGKIVHDVTQDVLAQRADGPQSMIRDEEREGRAI
jgi:hypothetical protein